MKPANSLRGFLLARWLSFGGALLAWIVSSTFAQGPPYQRTFPESKVTVEKVVRTLQSFTAGHLPVLDGFIVPGDRPLDRYQRGYFQCSIQVTATPTGGAKVVVSAKITAWYNDPISSKSGYQVLASNGRVESDCLDRLQELLAGRTLSPPAPVLPAPPPASPAAASHPTNQPGAGEPALSAPEPGSALPLDAGSNSASSGSPFQTTNPADDQAGALATRKAVADRRMEDLTKEAKNLEEILRNTSRPTNLAAVRKSGTPVLGTPSEGAKVLFLATAQDEFEILDTNSNWVHVRISGLSRGWIRRSSLEMLQAPTVQAPAPAPTLPSTATNDSNPFEIEGEQIASFPGTWEPLQGKTVKIVSVQMKQENATAASSPLVKRDFAKSIFLKQYSELAQEPSSAAGLVIVFDSADGGMVATTLPVLQAWKAGNISEEAFWRRCLFDPPEAFNSASGH